MVTGAGGGTTVVVVIVGAAMGGGFTLTSGGGTNEGGGGANFGGGGRFSGGGGGGGLASSMILVSIGALMTSIIRCANPFIMAQPNKRCRATTIAKPSACRLGARCPWAKSTRLLQSSLGRCLKELQSLQMRPCEPRVASTPMWRHYIALLSRTVPGHHPRKTRVGGSQKVSVDLLQAAAQPASKIKAKSRPEAVCMPFACPVEGQRSGSSRRCPQRGQAQFQRVLGIAGHHLPVAHRTQPG